MDATGGGPNGNLDEQIAQLVQCKPLTEPEVFLSWSYPFFHWSFYGWFGINDVRPTGEFSCLDFEVLPNPLLEISIT